MAEGGPYGVVIVGCAFMIQVISFGTESTIGVYNIEFLDYFQDQTFGVSLIGSINFLVYLASGPIVSLMMTKFSYRKITLGGSFLVVTGLLGMRFYPYIPTMCFFFGVLTGFGNCCVYIPSHVLSGLYYDKNRSLATGISNSGSGLGGAIMPVLAGFLIEIFSWKGSLMVMAGINMHLFIFCALLRKPSNPLPWQLVTEMEMEVLPKKPDAANASTAAITSDDKAITAGDNGDHNGDLYSFTDAETETETGSGSGSGSGSSAAMDEQILIRPSPSIIVNCPSPDSPVKIKLNDFNFKSSFKFVEDDSGHNFWGLDRSKLNCLMVETESFKTRSISSCGFGNNENSTNDFGTRSPSLMLGGDSKFMLKSQSFIQPSVEKPWELKPQRLGLPTTTSSLQPSVIGWRGSCIVRTDDQPHIQVKDINKHIVSTTESDTKHHHHHPESNTTLPYSARHVFIFTNYAFDVYFLSNMMWNAGYTIIQSFTPEFMIEQGLSSKEASWLSGAFGFGSFLGGILGACCGNVRRVDRKLLYSVANVAMGCMMLLFPNSKHVAFLAVTLVLSGLAFGVILGLLVIVLSDLIGPQSLGNGIGYLMLSNGIGAFVGPPTASLLREKTGGFRSSIFLAGGLCILGGVVMFLMPCAQAISCNRNVNNRTNNHHNNNNTLDRKGRKMSDRKALYSSSMNDV